MANTCGDCDICCKVFYIPELDSPKGEYCIHCDKGCTIHATRDQVCRDFECGYLANEWRPELRPDRCGVIVRQLRKDTLQAVRWSDNVSSLIMKQLDFIKENYPVKIQCEDGRVKDEQASKNIPVNQYNFG